MIDPIKFKESLNKSSFNFFTGVPDSVLKFFTNTLDDKDHIICVNEGAALGLSIGYNLATKKIPVVYLQNSGLGNLINPYLSISSKSVYNFPVLLIIGWRGKPGIKDAPQHIHQGLVTKDILKLMKVKVFEINEKNYSERVIKAKELIEKGQNVALLVEKNKFTKGTIQKISKDDMESFQTIKILKRKFADHLFVSSTGFTSRELYNATKELGLSHDYNFLNPGGMGHTLSIASSISKFSEKPVICLDGDGSFLMHMGSMHTLTNIVQPKKFRYFLLNNNSHDSVGGQSTESFEINFKALIEGFGNFEYLKINSINKLSQLKFNDLKNYFVELIINKRGNHDLKRPSEDYITLKNNFKANLSD
jgi:phosphonopyruvate decarboxylase